MNAASDADVLAGIANVVDSVLAYLGGSALTADPALKSWLPSHRGVSAWRVSAQLWVLLARVRSMVRTGRRCALRDLHYQLKQTELFVKGAPDVSAALVRLLDLLSTQLGRPTLSRSAVLVTASPKGVVVGPLTLMTHDGVRIDTAHEPWAIPGDLTDISRLRVAGSRARYLLVVEKHTVFVQLAERDFHREFSTILCTGRGFPDMGTRAFVRFLANELHLTPFSITDWNPAGLQIHLNYKEGNSAQARLEGDAVKSPTMTWIGLHHGDVRALPGSAFDDLSTRDKSIINNLLARPAHSPADRLIEREVRAMLSAGVKADLDHIGRGGDAGTDGASGGGGGAPLDLPSLIVSKMLAASSSAASS